MNQVFIYLGRVVFSVFCLFLDADSQIYVLALSSFFCWLNGRKMELFNNKKGNEAKEILSFYFPKSQ